MQCRNATGLHWWSHIIGLKHNTSPLHFLNFSLPVLAVYTKRLRRLKKWFPGHQTLKRTFRLFHMTHDFILSDGNTFEVPKEQTLSWEGSECWILPWGRRGFKLQSFSYKGYIWEKKRERLSRDMQNKQVGNHLCSRKRWSFCLFHVVNALISQNCAFLNLLLNTAVFT